MVLVIFEWVEGSVVYVYLFFGDLVVIFEDFFFIIWVIDEEEVFVYWEKFLEVLIWDFIMKCNLG